MSGDAERHNRLLQGFGIRGNLSNPGARLPSLRSPRDLTLGAPLSRRRNIAPNIPVKSEKRNEITPRNDEFEPWKRGRGQRGGRGPRDGERGRGRGRPRGRGRGRGGQEYIQLTSTLFSDGLPPLSRMRGRGGGGRGGERSCETSKSLQKPTVNFDFNAKVEEEEEEDERGLLEKLHTDNFVDDGSDDWGNAEGWELPVTLPMRAKQFFTVKEEVSDDIKGTIEVKAINGECGASELNDGDEQHAGSMGLDTDLIKIKEEPVSDYVEMSIKAEPMDEDDIKPKVKQEKKVLTKVRDNNLKPALTVGEVFQKAKRLSQGEMFLIQLPNPLPAIPTTKDEKNPKIKRLFGADAAPTASSSTTSSNANADNSEETVATLEEISEGYIGKIQIMKSGKARMMFGHVPCHLSIGNEISFLHDLVSLQVRNDEPAGALYPLGHIKHKLVCIPQMESMEGIE